MTFKLSAGTYPFEYAKGSISSNVPNNTIGASVFASRKGPLGPRLITGGNEEFQKLYGQGDYSWSQAHLCLKPALNEMTVFYGNRVVNDAKYAGLSLYFDSVNNKFFSMPFASGSSSDYENASKATKLLSFSDAIPSGKSITCDVGSTAITQVFNTTSNNTLALLATQIQGALDALGEGGNAQVIKTWNLSDRKMEVQISFDREFKVNDIVSLEIEGTPDITKTTVTKTYSSGTAIEFLQSIATDISGINGLQGTAIEGDIPAIIITFVNAGPASLKITRGSTMTSDLTYTEKVLREGHGVYDDRSILITLPESIDDLEISATITGTSVTATVDENAKLIDVFAENPGEWASNTSEGLGIKISNIDKGIQQRTRITLSQAIAQGNEFTCQIGYEGNTWATDPVSFNLDSDTTLKAIAQSIQSVLDTNIGTGGSVMVEEVTGGLNNDRSILIITPKSNQTITVTDALFTGGSTQPVCIVKEVIPATPSTQTFTLSVYNRESLKNPLESWTCSLKPQLDSNGNQMFITDRINKGAYKSDNIRVVSYSSDFDKIQEIDSIAWLAGGDDGYLPTNAQIIEGWQDFADPEKITVRLLMNCGYKHPDVTQAMASIAQNRKDCVAILGIPSDKQGTQDAYNYRQYEMNVNTSYAAVYSPDILVFDPVSGTDVYVDPSGYVAAQICYTERTRAIYWAPAGLNRGICTGAKGVRVVYGEGDRDLLEPVQINPIRNMGTSGIAIFGEYTTQTKKDPLSDLHVRLMANNIEIATTEMGNNHVFDPNDQYMRDALAKNISDYLKPIKDGRGLSEYVVVSDITKENASEIDLGVAVINVYMKPIGSAKFIRINHYFLGSGVSIEETEVAGI